jgi:predicted phosphodiesterase
MRWALLSDIHANLEALEAVLADLELWPGARILCAGDIVGYGPDPEACIELVRHRAAVCVCGNHEAMVLGRLGFAHCIYAGIKAASWTREVISPGARAYLAALPRRAAAPPDIVTCHGSLDDVEHYIANSCRADAVLEQMGREHPEARLLVCGHTHFPRVYARGDTWARPPVDVALRLDRSRHWLVNPGAVGQSRDAAAVARYARYDTDEAEIVFREVRYAHEVTLAKLREAGLVARVAAEPVSPVGRRIEDLQTRWARWATPRHGSAGK